MCMSMFTIRKEVLGERTGDDDCRRALLDPIVRGEVFNVLGPEGNVGGGRYLRLRQGLDGRAA